MKSDRTNSLEPDRSEDAQGATAPARPEDLSARVEKLRRRMRGLRVRGGEPVATAVRMGECERQLLTLSMEAAGERGERGGEYGYPLVDDCLDWCETAATLHLQEVAEAAADTARDLMRDEADACRRWIALEAGEALPDAYFDALCDATTLELDMLIRCPSGKGDGGKGDRSNLCEAPFGPFRQIGPVPFSRDDELLAEHRGELRAGLLTSLSQHPPSAAVRERWVDELVDRSDILRTTLDDVSLRLSVAQLARMADDLRWHLTHVEPKSSRRGRLHRKLAELSNRAQDRQVQHRLDLVFGPRAVVWFERMVLALVALVLGLLTLRLMVEANLMVVSHRALAWFEAIDALACLVLILEFGVKWWLAPRRGRWFRRHFLLELLPSIPFGLLVFVVAHDDMALVDTFRWGLLARYFLVLRPLILLVRAFGLLVRGLDRIARSYRSFLNRNVILYPTSVELERAQTATKTVDARLERMRSRLNGRWRQLLHTADPVARDAVARERLSAIKRAHAQQPPERPPRMRRLRVAHEIPASILLRRMATLTPQEAEADLGRDLTGRIAWGVRLLSRPPIRWLPIIKACFPRLPPGMTAAETTAAWSRQLSAVLRLHYDRWFWFSDLYGTVTPSVLVDRFGSMLVKSASRPAYRLILFGGLFLLTRGILRLFNPFGKVHGVVAIETFLGHLVGQTLVVLGGVCLVILGCGWWLKRLAREATEFYERVVQAQFLSLTENIRSRYLERDAGILYERVLLPEMRLGSHGVRPEHTLRQFLNRMRLSLLGTHLSDDTAAGFEALERTVLLYRDVLDGALMCDTDTRTTRQLLGNPALRQFQGMSTRMGPTQIKALQRLDLERQKTLLGGPYLWFNFISRSIAHSVARMIVDYNRHAIPLSELSRCHESARVRYQSWLAARKPWNKTGQEDYSEEVETTYVTTAFTALHFLDVDDDRDEQVARRFGPEVLSGLRRDRSLLIRKVFGTYPWHKLPKQQRVLNLFAIYEGWLGSGRAILLPWFVAAFGFKHLWALVKAFLRCVAEIRQPELRVDRIDAADADFHAAVRKIQRMRGPVVEASIRLRARMDPEYLGVRLPGDDELEHDAPQFETDIRFLGDDARLFKRLQEDRRRAEADMIRLSGLISGGLLQRVARKLGLDPAALATPEHMRAAAVAYLSDLDGVRSHLSSREILAETFEIAATEELLPGQLNFKPALAQRFRRYWKQHEKARRLGGKRGRAARRAAWRATQHNMWGAADALGVWRKLGDEAPAEGERRLAELLRHPGRITEQLVTMRAVQTLALLDVLNYRQHIFRLGDYSASEDVAQSLLSLTR